MLVSSSYLSNYVDDNTLHAFGLKLEEVKNVLRTDFDEVTRWFYEIYMTPKPINVILCVLERIP